MAALNGEDSPPHRARNLSIDPTDQSPDPNCRSSGADGITSRDEYLFTLHGSMQCEITAHGIVLKSEHSDAAEQHLQHQIRASDIEVAEELGRGASAVVKRAVHRETGDQFVVKCFNMYDENIRHQLQHELMLLLEVDCCAIADFRGAYLKDNRVCVVLEFMDRGSLQDLHDFLAASSLSSASGPGSSPFDAMGVSKPRSGPANSMIPERVLAAMTYQILWGLGYLNHEKMMHRDIKPPNILINSRGEVKLTDFGIGRTIKDRRGSRGGGYEGQALDAPPAPSGVSSASAAAASCDASTDLLAQTVVGTVSFMSPERLRGEEYKSTADIWSLGVMLCIVALGKHPLPVNQIELLQTLNELPNGTLGDLISEAAYERNFTDEFVSFVSWCGVVDPKERATAVDLLEDDWIDHHLGDSGMKQELVARAGFIVKQWLEDYVPSYTGPACPVTGPVKGGGGLDLNLETYDASDSD